MSTLPTRTFSANEGQASTGPAGPDAIEATFDDFIAWIAEHISATDGDHDGRYTTTAQLLAGYLNSLYYTEAEIDAKLQGISQGAVADESIGDIKLAYDVKINRLYGVRW